MNDLDFTMKVLIYLLLIISIALHEWGHAVSADKLGDPLPRQQGRVTLNPLAHLDPIGTGLIPIIMIFFTPGIALIGWGKPVQISLPHAKTRVRDDLIITTCGPLMNLVIVLAVTMLLALLMAFGLFEGENAARLFVFCYLAIALNCALILFNLVPVPPLDGSHYAKHAFKISDQTYAQLALPGLIVMLILINFPPFIAFFSGLIRSMAEFFIGIALLVTGNGGGVGG